MQQDNNAPYITTMHLGSGWAAIHVVRVLEANLPPYWDIEQTGFGRYKTEGEAIAEATVWAESAGIRYIARFLSESSTEMKTPPQSPPA